jgi:hypothetical protein
MLYNLFRIFGFDKAIVYVLLSKGWNILSGVVILLLISRFLTPEQQGYYFTFSSVLALQVLFELGFGSVVVQFVSHEMPKLKISRNASKLSVSGDEISLFRFYAIVRLVVKWYAVVALLILTIVLPAGIFFFGGFSIIHLGLADILSNHTLWFFPWISLVVSSVLTLTVTPVLSIAEGCGYVSDVAKVRFIQSLVNALIALFFLLTNHGLYVVVSSLLSLFFVGGFWAYKNFSRIIITSFKQPSTQKSYFSWRNEMFPVQWRIAVSWLSGFFIYQLFNPVAFKVYGPVFAGRLGMSLTISNLLLNLSLSWIMTKVPKFGNLISANKSNELCGLYHATFRQSVLFLVLIIVSSVLGLIFINYMDLFFVKRILSPELFLLLLASALGNHIVTCQATFIRAHKVELFMYHSLFSSFLIMILMSISLLTPSSTMIVGYFSIVWFFCVPYGIYIFKKFNRSKGYVYD